MPRYISLIQFTDQGAREVKNSPTRADAFNQAAARAGIQVESQFWTVGSYDGVLILQADNADKALHYLAELVAGGNVRTNTLQAFTEDEFKTILAAE
ncbi:MAG: hypothetical protein ACI9TH_001379 [Kiritimatiellia bacterium]|jgi:uncharacterized protein with GYD domain